MTKIDQLDFVGILANSIKNDIQQAIIEGKIPEDWDGHELRKLLADKFIDAAELSTLNSNKRGTRAARYRNTVLNNRLV